MIIIAQTSGTGLTNLAVIESVYVSRTGMPFETFEYDGADWIRTTGGDSTVVDLFNEYGITYSGTPVTNDQISVAQEQSQLWKFFAGNGINCKKLNENFMELQQKSNNNETSIGNLYDMALAADGSNLTSEIVYKFQQETPNIISADGDISLSDNSSNFLTLTGNNANKIVLPAIGADQYSHTIVLVVEGSPYSLDINTATGGRHLYNDLDVDPTQTYSVMFVYNKIDNNWYYYLTQ